MIEQDVSVTDRIPPFEAGNKIVLQKRSEKFRELEARSEKKIDQQKTSIAEYVSEESIIRMASDNIALECAKNKWSFNDGKRVS